MASSETDRNQFIEYIKLQTYDDKYIDRQEEKKILEKAIEMGIGIDEGLGILRQVASLNDWVVERDAEDRALEALATFAMDGQIDKKEFNDAVLIFKNACKDKLPQPEIRKRLKQAIQEKGWKAKEGGLFGSKWFSEI